MHLLTTLLLILTNPFSASSEVVSSRIETRGPSAAFAFCQLVDHHSIPAIPASDRLSLDGAEIDDEEDSEPDQEQVVKLPAFLDHKLADPSRLPIGFLLVEKANLFGTGSARLVPTLRC